MDATLTMRPYPRATMPGMTARFEKKTPSALIPMTRRHSSSVTSTVASDAPGTPAEHTRTSMGPSSRCVASTAASISAELDTSPLSASTPSAAAPWTSNDATRAPSASSRRAVAAPIPLDPPVTSATLPEKRSALPMALRQA
jgi:hypothetical protein